MKHDSRTLSLRWFFILPFLILFAAGTVFSCWLSQKNAQTGVRNLGYEFAHTMGNEIEGHLRHLVSPLVQVVELNLMEFKTRGIRRDAPGPMALHLVRQVRLFPQITFISLAFNTGRYVAATQSPTRDTPPLVAANFLEEAPFMAAGYAVDPIKGYGPRVTQPLRYDPRTRDYMNNAIAAGTPLWGGIEPYAGYPRKGIGLSAPLMDAQGRCRGVTGATLSLDRLNRFMETLDFGVNGLGFITESDNTLIAASVPPDQLPLDARNRIQLPLSQPYLGPTVEEKRPRAHPHHHDRTTALLTLNNTSYLYEKRTIDFKYGKTWTLGILIPQEKFLAPVARTRRQAFMLVGMTLVLSTLLGWYLAQKVARPIEDLNRVTQNRRPGTPGCFPRLSTGIREVDQLSLGLMTMARELSGAIHGLEERVARRTAALKEANETLLARSNRDGLTGLSNRRHFDLCLQREGRRARRNHSPLTLVLCDIDHFKRINDDNGHQKGDEILKQVAQCLETGRREPMDVVARYGGEEFALILTHTRTREALAPIKRIQERLKAIDLPNGKSPTLSFGVAAYEDDGISDEEASAPFRATDLVALADARLYQAKHEGRNCIRAGLTPSR